MAKVILPTEEHREDSDRPNGLIHIEPVDRPADAQMPRSWQDVVMAFAAMSGGQDALRCGTDFQDSRFRVVERALQALPEVEVAPQKMVEYQLEVAFGVGRELKAEDHARGVCRRSPAPAARPSGAR